MGFGFFPGFGLFGIMFTLTFLLVFGTILVTLIRGIREWNNNNHSPRLTVPATVVSKRTNVSRHSHNGAGAHHHSTTSTSYYVTFQFESGDRLELHLSGQQFGLLVEGDRGDLTFQGTRYLGFSRRF